MAFRLTRSDRETLACIAEHRVLVAKQITAIRQGNAQVTRRRLAALERACLVKAVAPRYGRSRGRPEKLISLTEEGIDVLRANGILGPDVPTHRVIADGIRCLDHQLLVNWVQIQLSLVERIVPSLSERFLAATSPFLEYGPDDRPLIAEEACPNGAEESARGFVPDGVLSITDSDRAKTVLFFLEVDMGTETLASPRRNPHDLRQKIVNYQALFRSRRYKRYERVWDCSLRGFRLLFVSHTAERSAAICRLVRDMPPTDFVWVTDQEQLISDGVWAKIWARGDRVNAPFESILDSQVPDSPPKPSALLQPSRRQAVRRMASVHPVH